VEWLPPFPPSVLGMCGCALDRKQCSFEQRRERWCGEGSGGEGGREGGRVSSTGGEREKRERKCHSHVVKSPPVHWTEARVQDTGDQRHVMGPIKKKNKKSGRVKVFLISWRLLFNIYLPATRERERGRE